MMDIIRDDQHAKFGSARHPAVATEPRRLWTMTGRCNVSLAGSDGLAAFRPDFIF
jgi:hypothetical protein